MLGRRTFLFLLAATQIMLVIAVPRSFARVAASITSCDGNGVVVINEFMPAPNAGSEWIEVFNASDEPIQLSGWSAVDAANNRKSIENGIVLDPQTVYAFDVNMLNDGGDTFRLLNGAQTVVDCVAYPKTAKGTAWARVPDGDEAWQETTEPTRGEANTPLEPTPTLEPPSVVINEFVPLPTDGAPWVELFNNGSTDAALDGLVLDNLADEQFPLPAMVVNPGDWFALNLPAGFYEAGDAVRLLQGDTVIDEYAFDAVPSQAFGRLPDGSDAWTSALTPTYGEANRPGVPPTPITEPTPIEESTPSAEPTATDTTEPETPTATGEVLPTDEPTVIVTIQPTTAPSLPAPSATAAPTKTGTPTKTATPTRTPRVPTPTKTPAPTRTPTPPTDPTAPREPTATRTPRVPTPTNEPTPTRTPRVRTPTTTATGTREPTATRTPRVPTPTGEPTPTRTPRAPTPAREPTPTRTPRIPTPTRASRAPTPTGEPTGTRTPRAGSATESTQLSGSTPSSTATRVVLSEIAPGNAWIELYNGQSITQTVDGWPLDDGFPSTAPLTITDIVIAPHGFVVIRDDALRDFETGTLRLLRPNGNMVDTVTYTTIVDGTTWSRYPAHGGSWQANTPPTPGEWNLPPPATPTATIDATMNASASPFAPADRAGDAGVIENDPAVLPTWMWPVFAGVVVLVGAAAWWAMRRGAESSADESPHEP